MQTLSKKIANRLLFPKPGNAAESSIAKAPRTHCAATCSTSQRNRDEWNLSPTGQPFMCARATRLTYSPSGEPSMATDKASRVKAFSTAVEEAEATTLASSSSSSAGGIARRRHQFAADADTYTEDDRHGLIPSRKAVTLWA